jgi:hypothetical protein
MSDERRELNDLAAALAALAPAGSTIDRDELMYRAGQASAVASRPSARRWLWPLATAACVLVSATAGFQAASRWSPQVVERIVHVPAPPPPSALPERRLAPAVDGAVAQRPAREESNLATDNSASYFHLRQQAIAGGIDSLPMASAASGPQVAVSQQTYWQLQQELLAPLGAGPVDLK